MATTALRSVLKTRVRFKRFTAFKSPHLQMTKAVLTAHFVYKVQGAMMQALDLDSLNQKWPASAVPFVGLHFATENSWFGVFNV